MTTPVGVVVVGAGAAGLAAARELGRHGVRTVVLEARDRIGGRVHTLRDPRLSLPVELGAEFVHGDAPRTTQLARDAGLAVVDVGGDQRSAARGRFRRVDFWPAVDRVLRRIDGDGEDRSLADFLGGQPGGARLARDRGHARRFVEGFHAANPRWISVHSLAPRNGESPVAAAADIGRIEGGYGPLLAHLAAPVTGALRVGW